MGFSAEQCPLCGSELTGLKFKEIQAKLGREEQEKAAQLAQAESALRLRLEQQFNQNLERQLRDLEKRAKNEAEARVKEVASERDLATRKLKEAEAREAQIRKEAQQEVAKEKLALQSKAKQVADQQAKQLASQRQSLETDKKLALVRQQAEFQRERESLQKKTLLMEKQLEKKTANELGDGAEIDLYESLREFFPTDKIRRIPKGQSGADILHEVLYKGVSCGRIIIDSKNHQGWQNAFVTKLRKDQIEAGAEHAILATTAFPAGKKELCIESGVIIISPPRVVYMTQVLRNTMITMHVKGLSMKERSTKMARLYGLITSESYSRKFVEAGKLAEEILELDVQEKKTHDNVWKKRGSLAKRVQNVLREVETDVASVIEGTDDEQAPPAFGVKDAADLAATAQNQRVI